MSDVDEQAFVRGEFRCKPNFDEAMDRIHAWYQGEIIDRAPIRFHGHNAEYDFGGSHDWTPAQWKAHWFDFDTVVERQVRYMESQRWCAETFPVFMPNLGPAIYGAFYGCDLAFEETTSWAQHTVQEPKNLSTLKLDRSNEYYRGIVELTEKALAAAKGKFMVGYTDLHPGFDCVAGWCDAQDLCLNLYDEPEFVKELLELSIGDFHNIYNEFDAALKKAGQLSCTWMGIPSYGKMHIPSCDFAALISPALFDEYAMPILNREVQGMSENIFHLDGPGVANHLDSILSVPEINAIQWVQGYGPDRPIMQYVPMIKKIQAAGKSVVVDLDPQDLNAFMGDVSPEGILLCINEHEAQVQDEIIAAVRKWK
jgi:hypothetical protein